MQLRLFGILVFVLDAIHILEGGHCTLESGTMTKDELDPKGEGGVLGCVVGLVESHDQRIHPVKLRGHPRIDTE
jgi:hypothetical protein